MRSLVLAAAALTLTTSAAAPEETDKAIFAGGCFWCVEKDFDKVPGVLATVSGYKGGHVENPSYRQVVAGTTGHREVVQITYDPNIVTYERLLEVFWHSVDPTDGGGQFCDRGFAYTTAIYVDDAEERALAEQSKARAAETLNQPIATVIETASTFWPAEVFHQDYYRKNPRRYQFYRWSCGRDGRVRAVWGERAYVGIDGSS